MAGGILKSSLWIIPAKKRRKETRTNELNANLKQGGDCGMLTDYIEPKMRHQCWRLSLVYEVGEPTQSFGFKDSKKAADARQASSKKKKCLD